MTKHTYTRIQDCGVIVCDDCGAFANTLADQTEADVRHYSSCKPTDHRPDVSCRFTAKQLAWLDTEMAGSTSADYPALYQHVLDARFRTKGVLDLYPHQADELRAHLEGVVDRAEHLVGRLTFEDPDWHGAKRDLGFAQRMLKRLAWATMTMRPEPPPLPRL